MEQYKSREMYGKCIPFYDYNGTTLNGHSIKIIHYI